ncbi:dihydrolipoyl dehydrogenase family protein [Rhodococcus spongiicola]|uniref:dihydrolipoyl dehydrogenase family protein n=1 Tax=Rhodococcus spongiicola TaxID=2487352 RepID=UPI001F2838A0|nr:FAD-dependent oxidoreductase [Rhodococcus spongiicola]
METATVAPQSAQSVPRSADLVVLGGGSAGIVAAKTAAGFGAKVVLVERDRTGGDCLWTGCVPSKALLAAASVAAAMRRGQAFGIDASNVTVDFSRVMTHVQGAIETIAPVDSPDTLRAANVNVVSGTAHFTGPRSLAVGANTITFGQAVIATGAAPAVPKLPSLDQVDYLTSETIWGLTELPPRLTVLGGGSVGCELAQAFARLGSAVTIVEAAESLLPAEDRDAAALVTQSLIDDGVDVLTRTTAESVTGRALVLTDGRRLEFDSLLVAVGRKPRTTSIGLDTAGVTVDRRGFVTVDKHLRTTNPRIWAAGDLTGHPQFTHTAGMHGSIAATNAILGLRRTVDRTGTPRVTFTDPEIAVDGIDTEAAQRIPGLHVHTLGHEHVDRAVAERETRGFTKLVLDGKHRIVGATVVGPRAGETIGEMVLAIKQGLRTRDLAGTTHPYPTYNDAPWNASIADVRSQLARPIVSGTITTLARVRRMWQRRLTN